MVVKRFCQFFNLSNVKVYIHRTYTCIISICITKSISLQCRRILGGRNLVRVRNIVVAAIFDFMTVEDWGE